MRARAFLALALLACACGRDDRDEASGAVGALPSSGPDPIVVRIPRDGGTVRAYRYPNLDSLIWRSQQPTPALDRVLSFDAENGVLSYLAQNGSPGWLDLRLGTARAATRATLASIASADGWSIFGVTDKNAIVRLTPSGDWQLPRRGKIRRLFPLADGTLLVLTDHDSQGYLLRLRPPDESISDSLEIPRPDRAVATPLGDRLYLSVKRELLSVPARDLGGMDRVKANDEILAIAPTPSGDRVFLASRTGPRLEVMDRYAGDINGTVTLPGMATEMRMDPMGRFLLVRPVRGDSAWVVAIATNTLVGTVATQWRHDLPAVAVDGLVATVRGDDVAFVDAAKGTARRSVAGGARDAWFLALWNGLRPRAQGVDVPVEFSLGEAIANDSTDDSLPRLVLPAAPARIPPRDTVAVTPPPDEPTPPPPPPREGWTVSFAAVLSEERAREIAGEIDVDGQRPRVVKGETAGTTVYRVVYGPYLSKADAERMGRASKHSFWVYQGVP